ncbi:MAG TPA: hypothetical protein VHN37_12080 [Actinomycetota bacterium]|nr:hypothetical protein [Actinomycetota bacterium]
MDEPKQSAARSSGFMIPLGLALLLVAYLWREDLGPATYSRLLGAQAEGEALDVRIAAVSIVANLALFVVAVASFRRATAVGRTFVCGLAALLGVHEILQSIAFGVVGEVVFGSMVLSAFAGLLLIVAALGATDRERTRQIRESEGGRA